MQWSSKNASRAEEIAMDGKSSAFAIRTLLRIAFLGIVVIAVTVVPTALNNETDAAKSSNLANAQRPASAPIVVAQGRCFNGRCF
jgi:hypothetical protein